MELYQWRPWKQLQRSSLLRVFLKLFSANADVKISFFLNAKTVQAYSDTSFLWRGFEITEPSVCCHLLLPWKWICQVSWKQVSNKPLLWKIMHGCGWWCHPPITVHLLPRNSQLAPASSVCKALLSSSRTTAAGSHLSLEWPVGSPAHCAPHSHALPCGLSTLPPATAGPSLLACIWEHAQWSCNVCLCCVLLVPSELGSCTYGGPIAGWERW